MNRFYKQHILLLAFTLGTVLIVLPTAEAGLFDKLKEKVQDKVEDAVDETIGSTSDDSSEDSEDGSHSQGGQQSQEADESHNQAGSESVDAAPAASATNLKTGDDGSKSKGDDLSQDDTRQIVIAKVNGLEMYTVDGRIYFGQLEAGPAQTPFMPHGLKYQRSSYRAFSGMLGAIPHVSYLDRLIQIDEGHPTSEEGKTLMQGLITAAIIHLPNDELKDFFRNTSDNPAQANWMGWKGETQFEQRRSAVEFLKKHGENVIQRFPRLPVRKRAVTIVRLGPYDFEDERLAIRPLNYRSFDWPSKISNPALSELQREHFLEIARGRAELILNNAEKREKFGRVAYIVRDYQIMESENDGSASLRVHVERIVLSYDFNGTRIIHDYSKSKTEENENIIRLPSGVTYQTFGGVEVPFVEGRLLHGHLDLDLSRDEFSVMRYLYAYVSQVLTVLAESELDARLLQSYKQSGFNLRGEAKKLESALIATSLVVIDERELNEFFQAELPLRQAFGLNRLQWNGANEFERMATVEKYMRHRLPILLEKLPSLPLRTRTSVYVILDEYDWAKGGFPLDYPRSIQDTNLYFDLDFPHVARYFPLPSFLEVPAAEAEAMMKSLAKVERRERRLHMVIDGEILPQPDPLQEAGRPIWRGTSAVLSLDSQGTHVLRRLESSPEALPFNAADE